MSPLPGHEIRSRIKRTWADFAGFPVGGAALQDATPFPADLRCRGVDFSEQSTVAGRNLEPGRYWLSSSYPLSFWYLLASSKSSL